MGGIEGGVGIEGEGGEEVMLRGLLGRRIRRLRGRGKRLIRGRERIIIGGIRGRGRWLGVGVDFLAEMNGSRFMSSVIVEMAF
jgi:hypothetical protein